MVVLSGPHLCVNLCLAVLPAQLASYRQKRAKGDASGEAKKTQKRKGPAVAQIQSAAAQDAELNSRTNHEVHRRPGPPLWHLSAESKMLCMNAVLDISRAKHLIQQAFGAPRPANIYWRNGSLTITYPVGQVVIATWQGLTVGLFTSLLKEENSRLYLNVGGVRWINKSGALLKTVSNL